MSAIYSEIKEINQEASEYIHTNELLYNELSLGRRLGERVRTFVRSTPRNKECPFVLGSSVFVSSSERTEKFKTQKI